MARQPTKAEWAEIQRLFDELLNLPAATRETRLGKSVLDPFIEEQVRSLLEAACSDGILDGAGPVAIADAHPSYSSLGAGDIVGAFTIDRLIGRGGMGEVYVAHRAGAGFEQQAALKLLRPEAAERGEMFDRERRLLAGLEHPGIARLIDGGRAPDGRAYMAMEYVEGVPIDAWCRDHRADLPTRLRLIIATCDAVAYAHANLIIHRDLKPSNIMVDRAGRVRLLDFGIAKILDDSAPVMATQVLLTPDYAAPEQLGNGAPSVATDVYAMGAVLYELLAGQGPWRGGDTSLPSIIRRVLHDDPPLPSDVATRSGTPVPARLIAGDLDAIVMKAMRRKPEDRYRSAADLADDLQRHLDLKPVRARAGSTGYAVGRFVRRYRWAVGAGVAAFLALFIGAGGVAWQARQTAIERDVAITEARRADAINQMLATAFRESGEHGKGDDTTVKQMLNEAATRLVTSVDKSAKSAELIFAVAVLYIHIDDQHSAETLLDKALAAGIGRDDPVIIAQIKLKLASIKAFSNKVTESRCLLVEALPVFQAEPNRYREELVDAVVVRAIQARRSGNPEVAVSLLKSILPQLDSVYVGDEREQVRIRNTLLSVMLQAKQLDEFPAILALTKAALKRTGQENSLQGINTMQHEGRYYLLRGDTHRAESMLASTVKVRRSLYGPSAALAGGVSYLADAKLATGKPAEAVALFGEARELALKYLGPTGDVTISSSLKLSRALAKAGQADRALKILSEVEGAIGTDAEYEKPRSEIMALRSQIERGI